MTDLDPRTPGRRIAEIVLTAAMVGAVWSMLVIAVLDVVHSWWRP